MGKGQFSGMEYNGIWGYHGSRVSGAAGENTFRGFETLNSLKHPIWDLKYRGISLMNSGT
jgi:hypothetical protein